MKKDWDKIVREKTNYKTLDEYFEGTKEKKTKEVYSEIGMSNPTFFKHMLRLGIKRGKINGSPKKKQAIKTIEKMGYKGISGFFEAKYKKMKNKEMAKVLNVSPELIRVWAIALNYPVKKGGRVRVFVEKTKTKSVHFNFNCLDDPFHKVNKNKASAQGSVKDIINDFKKRIEKNKLNGIRIAESA